MANLLVTGAAGFIGSHTADQLIAAGHQVHGVDNLRTGRLENIRPAIRAGLSFHEFDLLAVDRLDRLLRKVRFDAIIHLAALVSVSESIADPAANFRLNVEATQGMAEAARRHGVRRIVFASSASVYGHCPARPVREDAALQPISPYGAAKLASEYLLLAYATSYGLTVRIQRYFNIYGLRQDSASPYSGVISQFVHRSVRGQPMTIYGDGRQTRDFVHVSDVAHANLLAATKQGIATGAANICTGKPTSLRQLARTLSRLSPGRRPPLEAPARRGEIVHSVGSAVAAKQELGFSARRSVAAGLAELVAFEQARI